MKQIALTTGLVLLLVLTAAWAAEESRGLEVTVNYGGEGKVSAEHAIYVWVFDDPEIGSNAIPISYAVATSNGETVSMNVSASPVYLAVHYDEQGGYDPTLGPPVPGSPVGLHSDETGAPKPVEIEEGSTASVELSFDDTIRMPG